MIRDSGCGKTQRQYYETTGPRAFRSGLSVNRAFLAGFIDAIGMLLLLIVKIVSDHYI